MNWNFLKTHIFGFNIFPLQKIIISFIFLIITGTGFLMLPVSTTNGIHFIDALFTSTSAVCVTGLTVLDTAKDFTFFGKIIIFTLIQFGGFGIMTFSLGIISLLGKNLSLKWKITLEGLYSDTGKMPIKKILIRVIKYTLFIESFIAFILFSQFIKEYSILKSIEYSVFLSVSAFCNAGFSVFSNSLITYQTNYILNFAIISAIICGGLGFITLSEISNFKLLLFNRKKPQLRFFSIHSKLVIIVTIILIFTGTFLIFILERNYALSGKTISNSLLISLFQSVTCRTAGFNTIDIGSLRDSTLSIMIALMFIGGSPGSIAGGIKTTTIAVIFLLLHAKFQGKNNVSVFGRTLPNDLIDKSIILFVLAVFFIMIITFLILSIGSFDKENSFLSVLFETVSAFGTVGLSTGVTSKLEYAHKLLLILTMFIGRVGLLTFIMSFSLKNAISIQYPKEQIMIG